MTLEANLGFRSKKTARRTVHYVVPGMNLHREYSTLTLYGTDSLGIPTYKNMY